MTQDKPKEKEEPKAYIVAQNIESLGIEIPQCCREGWDSCPHVAKPHKKTKQNIGL